MTKESSYRLPRAANCEKVNFGVGCVETNGRYKLVSKVCYAGSSDSFSRLIGSKVVSSD